MNLNLQIPLPVIRLCKEGSIRICVIQQELRPTFIFALADGNSRREPSYLIFIVFSQNVSFLITLPIHSSHDNTVTIRAISQ